MTAGDKKLNIIQPISTPRSREIIIYLSDGLKRVFDILVSGTFLFLFSPFYLFIAIAIKRDSPGPVFYRGWRTGRHGKRFNILKFRTMYETPESYDGPRVTAHDDSRITEFGRWLRDTKINEFPQFWNVLIGDMSLVGPRPEDPQLAKTWPKNVWDEVLSVRPGITSPASVQYRNEEKLLSNCNVEQSYLSELSPDKVRLDQLYIRYRSFLLDIDTMFWTALALFPRLGAHKLPENLLFLGIFSRIVRRFVNWFTLDFITTFIAYLFAEMLFRVRGPLNVGDLQMVSLTFAFAVIFSGLGVVFGTNRIQWSKANPGDLFDLVPSWILATTIAFIIGIVYVRLPGDLILAGSLFSLFGFIMLRTRNLIIKHFLERSIFFRKKDDVLKERVLIIGLGASAQHTAWLFEHLSNSRLYHIAGFVDNDLLKQGSRYFGSNVIGTWQDIPALVKKHDIGLIILADYRVDSKGYATIKRICSSTHARLVVMPDILASINLLAQRRTRKSNNQGLSVDTNNYKCIDCLAKQNYLSRTGFD